MAKTELSRQGWIAAHFMAGNLAYREVSKNIVLQVRDYLTRHPGADPVDFARRLWKLDDAHAGGQDEPRQREELYRSIRDIAAAMPQIDWPIVLSWAARLIVAYESGSSIKRSLKRNLKQLEEGYYG
jgi:hypothetical protein